MCQISPCLEIDFFIYISEEQQVLKGGCLEIDFFIYISEEEQVLKGGCHGKNQKLFF